MDGVNQFFKIPYYNEKSNNVMYNNYIMNVKNNEIKIFKPSNNNPVGEDVVIYAINDLKNCDYMKFDLTKQRKMFIDMFFKLPLKLTYICFSESFAIDESNNIVYFILNKEKNGYNLKIIKPTIIDKDIYELENKYREIFNLLGSDNDVEIDGIKISNEFFKKCIEDSTIIETLNYNEKLKNMYITLLTYYEKLYNTSYNEIKKEKKLIKNNNDNGFVNKLFIVSLAGFTFAILIIVIILIVKKSMF